MRNSSLDAVFRPKSIAVIGASTKPFSIGYEVFNNIIRNNFTGKVFPVNPGADVVHSMKCYPAVSDIPDEIDMAVIIVARQFVPAVVEECGRKGVKGVVVITGGFKETGQEGARLEDEVLTIVRKYGMRMVGPNCFGVANLSPEVRLDATFSKMQSLYGRMGLISQSGALGQVIMEYARSLNVGISMFASIGNKADVSGNDLLLYWQDDPEVELILLYLENFGNPNRFVQIAGQITGRKPIICVKAGRTEQGARAVSSHTGVLSNFDVGVDALFDKCGVIRAYSIEEMFDIAMMLRSDARPRGNAYASWDRIGIITNAGGPAILATDACINEGLEVPELSPGSQNYLRQNLMDVAAVNNPVDVIASGGPDAYRASMTAMMHDEAVDTLLVIYVPPIMTDHRTVIETIIDVRKKHDKPVIVCFMGPYGHVEGSERLLEENIPVYMFPEYAAKTLSIINRYYRWLKKPRGSIRQYPVDKNRVRRIVDAAANERRKNLIGVEGLEILDAYGIHTAGYATASSEGQLPEAVEKTGFPVVMKINKPVILHKTDVGGVITNIKNEEELKDAFCKMKDQFTAGGEFEVIVQARADGDLETVMGMTTDPSFGPLMMFGLGGIYVEVMKDVSFKINPLTDVEAGEMIESIKGYKLLTGFRGAEPIHIETLVETLLRLSQLVSDFPEFDQFDVNPFFVSSDPGNCVAVDARIILR
jgi:acetyl coenzyme A synthetase (ADP forming)-like protein